MKELFEIQQLLEVPKDLKNDFAGFQYRNAEGILRELKPLLKERNCILKLSDELVNMGDRYYIKAEVTLINDKGEKESATGYAREELVKKGMDASQITGSTSSYARKYALNGLFAIDDGIDADSMDNRISEKKSTNISSAKINNKPMTERPVSTNQISLIKRLGGTVTEGMSMADASNLIEKLNEAGN